MSIILETLNLLAANIYSTLCSENQGMKLCVKVQCIFHSAGCESAALLHKSHGQCDFPWMQAFWHCNLNFPIVLSGNFCSIFAICDACILITVFNVHPPSCPSPLCCFLLLFTTIIYISPILPSQFNNKNPKPHFTCHYPMCACRFLQVLGAARMT